MFEIEIPEELHSQKIVKFQTGIIYAIKIRQYLSLKTFLKTPTVQALSLVQE